MRLTVVVFRCMTNCTIMYKYDCVATLVLHLLSNKNETCSYCTLCDMQYTYVHPYSVYHQYIAIDQISIIYTVT